MFSALNGKRMPPYGALDYELTASPSERLLMQENTVLRHSVQQLLYQVNQLTANKDHLTTQCHTYHLLYVQMKQDRNRMARNLTSAQRELEHLRRAQVLTNQIALGHHPLETLHQKHPSCYRSLKTKSGGRKGSRRFRRSQSAKFLSQESFPSQSTYKRFDTLNEYTTTKGEPTVEQHCQQLSPIGGQHQQEMTQKSLFNDQQQPVAPEIVDNQLYFNFEVQRNEPPYFEEKPSQNSVCSDSEDETEFKRPKLMYRDSLKQCVEFSRSLLDLSKRHIVGAELENSENTENINIEENDPIQYDIFPPEEIIFKEDQGINTFSESKEMITSTETPQPMSETKAQQTQEDLIEETGEHPMEQQRLECAPIEFDSADSLVVNLSYISNCTTYLREVRLPNKKPKSFLGIFFESALLNGIVVQQVVPNSIAARHGIRAGDRVLEICGINMRKANFRLADKIIQECDTDVIDFKVVSSDAVFEESVCDQKYPGSSSSSSGDDISVEETGIERARPLRKTCTLTRREAFKNKNKLRTYFDRKNGNNKDGELRVISRSPSTLTYQTMHLTVSLPRRIHVTKPLAKMKLLGGNAVGIFVHSIGDDFLANLLQTGDQLLEYNNFDLTTATAEDAALELAKPVQNTGTLVALFNLNTYNQIQSTSTGDSFYIRAEFSRASIKNSLEFKKGDILYVDNTLYEGKPGNWRAWRVDEFGQKTACGVIPSRHKAQCELQQVRSQSTSKWTRFRFFTLPYRILFWRSKPGYTKLSEPRQQSQEESPRILASCTVASYSPLINSRITEEETNQNASKPMESSPEESTTEAEALAKSYQRVKMLPSKNPRPVLIYGPFSKQIARQLEGEFGHLYRQCFRQSIVMPEGSETGEVPSWERYLHCSTLSDTFECIALADIKEAVDEGLHPVISVDSNTVQDFQKHSLFPIVVGLKYRSAKHIKDTANKWNTASERPRSVGYKMAKNCYNHMLKLEHAFKDSTHVRIAGNNLTFMCTQIKDRVREEQNKIIWKEEAAPK